MNLARWSIDYLNKKYRPVSCYRIYGHQSLTLCCRRSKNVTSSFEALEEPMLQILKVELSPKEAIAAQDSSPLKTINRLKRESSKVKACLSFYQVLGSRVNDDKMIMCQN